MKTKNEICVHIRNEKELQQARDILERNGEKIDERFFKLFPLIKKNYLIIDSVDKDWILTFKGSKALIKRTTIKISELESFLQSENIKASNVNSKSSIDWMFEEIKRRQEIILSEPDGITRETMIECLSNGLIEQAKQMRREEIEKAINTGHGISTNVDINFDFYYNKNYEP